MLLESIEASCFRNLSGKICWGRNLNIIFGDNGQGKTNWLEAIYLLATTKSFRTQRPQEAIQFNEQIAVISGLVTRSQKVSRELQVVIQGATKTLWVNGKREPVARYLGQLHVVSFTSGELGVIRGGPDARRKFLDRGIISLHHSYIQTLAGFHRVIKQKNRLLQDAAEAKLNVSEIKLRLEPWNEQLIGLSAEIHRTRTDYTERLQQALERHLFEREDVSIRYVSSLEGKGDISDYKSLLAERLQLRLPAELSAGYTLIGPHRDDLEILFDGRDIATFGSSGQQRSALILLDLAVISVYHMWHKEYPVFLIDDADAELDGKRIRLLLEYLENRTQTFITTSKEGLVRDYKAQAETFEIVGGLARVRDSESKSGSDSSTVSSI